MAIQQFTENVEIIQGLLDHPNLEGGMTAEELKKKFDAAAVAIKAYINDTLVPEINRLGDMDAGLAEQIEGILTDVAALQQTTQTNHGDILALVEAYNALVTRVSNVEVSIAALIQDDAVSPNSTWSSQKIKGELNTITPVGAAITESSLINPADYSKLRTGYLWGRPAMLAQNPSYGSLLTYDCIGRREDDLIFQRSEGNAIETLTLHSDGSIERETTTAAQIDDESVSEGRTWSSEKIDGEMNLRGGVGRSTPEGGEIFGDYKHNEAGELAAAFGEGSKALSKGAFASGAKKDRSGAPDEPADSDWRYNEALGTGSMASGMGAVAYSRASKSLGYRTQAGYPTSAEQVAARPEAETKKDANGNVTYPAESVSQAAVAIGADTAAVGKHSLAGGYKSKARGDNAVAIGSECEANANMAVAMGNAAKAKGVVAVAIGNQVEASGDCSFAGGVTTKAPGKYSAVFGHSSETPGDHAFAAGSANKARGVASAVFGAMNEVAEDADAAAVFGYENTATGHYTFVAGNQNATDPNKDTHCAAVFGKGNTANGIAQFVCGAYADPTEDMAFVVGGGSRAVMNDPATTTPRNAAAFTWDGGIILPSSTPGSNKVFKITIDDSGVISATEYV